MRNLGLYRLPRDLSGLRQRELAHHLNFPDSEAVVRVLRKVPSEALDIERLTRLRNAVVSPEVLKALSHLNTINGGVISLASEPLLFSSITPPFLSEVAQDDTEPEAEGAVGLLRQALDILEEMEQPLTLRVASIARLRELHEEITRDYGRWVEARIESENFPPPPIPGLAGIIEPLFSAEDLVIEGREQSNCVASYAARVRKGQSFIYRVLQPERATLSLTRRGSGRWEVGELKASHNRRVSDQTQDLVEQWLGDWSLGV